MPPVLSRTHWPQAWQRSTHTPCFSGKPKKLVFKAGTTGKWLKRSAMVCTPMPHPIETRRSLSLTTEESVSTNSGSHCLSILVSSISTGWPRTLNASRRAEVRMAASLAPPDKQTVTHVLQPITRTFLCSPIISIISDISLNQAHPGKRCRGKTSGGPT